MLFRSEVSSLNRFANHPYTLSDLTLATNKNGDDHEDDDEDDMMPLSLLVATGTVPRHL